MKLTHLLPPTSVLLVALTAAACSGPPSDATEQANDALFGGFPASDDAFDAVGNIIEMINTANGGLMQAKCTGTLIGPHTVLTASHCVHKYVDRESLHYTEHYFRIGYDSTAPKQTIRIVGGAVGPNLTGGPIGVGQDIGVFQLAEDVVGITPIAVATTPLGTADINQQFLQVGYGQTTPADPVGTIRKRQLGSEQLIALTGNAVAALFPNQADLVTYLQPIYPGATIADVAPLYTDATQDVLTGLQGFFSGAHINGVQPCLGDSGGPALRGTAGHFEIVGIQSGVYTADNPPCWGGSFEGLVAETGAQAFITAALADATRDVPVKGYCNADTAIRSNPASDWIDASSIIDCEPLGLACAIDSDGDATCAAPKPLVGPATTCSILGKFTHPNGAVFDFLADGTYTVRGNPYGTYTFTNGVLTLNENVGSLCYGSAGEYAVTFNAACTQYTLDLLSDGCRLRAEGYDAHPYTQSP